MKQFLFIFATLSLMFSSNSTHASSVIGATEPTQWLNNFELVGVNISDAVTAFATEEDMIENTILDPIANGLIAIAQQELANNVVDWANGGFEGNPLIIDNPERYIKEQGLLRVKEDLGYIPKDSIFGDSVFSAIYNSQREVSAQEALEELSRSDLPAIIQGNACNENNLLTLAQNQAGGGTEADVQTAYDSLSADLCEGDPEDPETAQKLLAANDQNPSVGGWDAWSSLTGGENAYTRGAKAQNFEADRVQKDKEAKILEVEGGGIGPKSDKECTTPATTNENGEPYGDGEVVPCVDENTLTPSSIVEESLGDAVTASMDRLANIQGNGSLVAILQGFATSYLMKGLNTAFTSSGKSVTNRPTTVVSSSIPKKDLANDPKAKDSITDPMLKLLDTYSTSLNELTSVDNTYLSSISSYQSRVQGVKSCFDALVNDFPTLAGDSRVSSANSFYQNRMNSITPVRNTINQELSSITPAKNLVNQTISKINAAQSSAEMSTIFTAYQDTIDNGNYPSLGAERSRLSEYKRTKLQADSDSEIGAHNSKCANMRNEQQQNLSPGDTGGAGM